MISGGDFLVIIFSEDHAAAERWTTHWEIMLRLSWSVMFVVVRGGRRSPVGAFLQASYAVRVTAGWGTGGTGHFLSLTGLRLRLIIGDANLQSFVIFSPELNRPDLVMFLPMSRSRPWLAALVTLPLFLSQ